jgi:hypothetical protein
MLDATLEQRIVLPAHHRQRIRNATRSTVAAVRALCFASVEPKSRVPRLRERAAIDRSDRRRKNTDLELLRHHSVMLPLRCERSFVAGLPS